MIEKALRSLVLAIPGVTAEVGDRMYPLEAKEGQSGSYLTYQRVSAVGGETCDGSDDLLRSRFQITAWSAKYETAVKIAAAIRTGLAGLQTVQDGVEIDAVLVGPGDAGIDGFDPEQRKFSRSLDVIVWHEQT